MVGFSFYMVKEQKKGKWNYSRRNNRNYIPQAEVLEQGEEK